MKLDAFFPNEDWDIFETCYDKWFLRGFTTENYRVELHTYLAFNDKTELDFIEESLIEVENYCSYLSRVYHDEKLHELFFRINKLSEHPIFEIKSISDIKPILGNWWGNGEQTKKDLKIQLNRLKPISSDLTKTIKKTSSLPYQIALLNELGFFDLDKFKNLPQSKVYQITAKLLNANKRGVSGNHRVLSDNTKEDRLRYTADKHIDDVKKYLDKL